MFEKPLYVEAMLLAVNCRRDRDEDKPQTGSSAMSIASAREKETKASPKTLKFYHAPCRSSFVPKYNSYLPKLEKWQTKSSPERYNSGMTRAYAGERNRRNPGDRDIRQTRCGIWLNRWQTYQSNHYGGYLFFFFSFVFYVYMQPLGYNIM